MVLKRLIDVFHKISDSKGIVLIDFVEYHVRFLYTVPLRSYHNITHVVSCLRELDSYAADNPSVDPALLLQAEFALWYHDIVYIPGYSDNEQKSAEILIMHGEALGVPFKVTCACAQAIIATRHKYPYPLSEALPKIVADIDLAILGADPEKYDSYKVGIRKEYESTPIDIYAKVRADLLEKEFLSRKEIYQTEYFRSKYEKQARQNMAREISDLRESIC